MCVIVTAGIEAVSTSDEPVGKVVITVFKLNQTDPEAPPIPIKTFEGSYNQGGQEWHNGI